MEQLEKLSGGSYNVLLQSHRDAAARTKVFSCYDLGDCAHTQKNLVK